MEKPHCRVKDIATVQCNNLKTKVIDIKPSQRLINHIPLLWKFLELVVEDWERYKRPFQSRIDKVHLEYAYVFYEIQPYYLKCIFSYVLFFRAVQFAYEELHAEIGRLNGEIKLGIKKIHKPKDTNYIAKVTKIRNLGIAHVARPKKKGGSEAFLDWLVAGSWQAMKGKWNLEQRPDLDSITAFCTRIVSEDSKGRTIKSADLEIRGIPELHRECMNYLNDYDRSCDSFMRQIAEKLSTPITLNGIEYSVSNLSKNHP